MDRVVPVAVERVAGEVDGIELCIADLETFGALAAVDDPFVAVAHGRRPGPAGVGAGVRLGETEGGQLATRGQLGHPRALLFLGAEEPDRRRAKTVSYTHLRAHETGRNLVCR